MFERIVSIPFDYDPIKLLAPCARDSKAASACLAQGRDGGWPFKVTLKIAIGPQFFENVGHHNRMIAVRSEPGFV
jgi:hypothetical protein